MITRTADETLFQYEVLGIDEVDDILEHFGTKGMRWGVRRRSRIERTIRVGKGEGSLLDKTRVHTVVNPGTLVKTKGNFRTAAARKGARLLRRNEAVAQQGKAKIFKDILPLYFTRRTSDIFPVIKKKKLTADDKRNYRKITAGKEFTITFLPYVIGI